MNKPAKTTRRRVRFSLSYASKNLTQSPRTGSLTRLARMAHSKTTPLTTGPLKLDATSLDTQYSHTAERERVLGKSDNDWEHDVLLKQPAIRDDLTTESLLQQDDTREDCLPLLYGISNKPDAPTDFNFYGVPSLQRELHIEYLHDSLQQLPSQFVGFDASRPWIIYWALLGLSLLGEDVSPYRERYVHDPSC